MKEVKFMKMCVAGIVTKEETDANGVVHSKILIGKKIEKEGHYLSNQWHIPGGHMLEGETEEQAVIREIKEECNLDVQILEKIDERTFEDFSLSWYLCVLTPNGVGDERAGDDLQELKWVDKKDVCNACSHAAVSRWPDKLKLFFS